MFEANEAASYVQELAGDDANIIFGVRYDDSYPDECSITVMATGIGDSTPAPVSYTHLDVYKRQIWE